jgi:predicted nucleic acid-binding protein
VAWYYLDTSALAKRYVREPGSGWIRNLFASTQGHRLWTVRLSGPELVAALWRKVRTGEESAANMGQAVQAFRTDWQHRYQIVEVTPLVAEEAMRLAEQHGLRGYDAVHLAAALSIVQVSRLSGGPALVFLSADDQQLQAAQSEGLGVENPNQHP